jgi:excisionase family DNA binding protein
MADKLTVSEAAEALGITRDAVYKRIERDKIRHERDADGQLYVYVEKSGTSQRQNVQSESGAVTSALEARIESLERQLEEARDRERLAEERDRENRRLLAAALERIPPQLEAPSEARESSVPKSEGDSPTPEEPPRPWWRRMFGG